MKICIIGAFPFVTFLAFDIGMSKLIISKYVTRVFLKAIFGGVIHKKQS